MNEYNGVGIRFLIGCFNQICDFWLLGIQVVDDIVKQVLCNPLKLIAKYAGVNGGVVTDGCWDYETYKDLHASGGEFETVVTSIIWAKEVLELAKKVHASGWEFETVVTSTIEEVASACRERTADVMQWIHCLSLIGLLLENIESSRILHGKAIELSEILHSLLLPGGGRAVKHQSGRKMQSSTHSGSIKHIS